MCGIVAVLRRPVDRVPASPADVLGALDADDLEAADRFLRGPAGVRTLLDHPDLGAEVEQRLRRVDAEIAAIERDLDEGAADIEEANARVVRLKDLAWAIRCDRLRAAAAVADLAGP